MCFSRVSPVLLLLAAWGLAAHPASLFAASATDGSVAHTPRAQGKPVFTLYLENDTIAGTDRHYTNGLKLSWVTADLTTWGQTGWRQRFVERLPFVNRTDAQKNFGFAIGQNIYTPQDIELVPPDPEDRPYAGWTYLEFSFSSRTATLMDTLTFQLGIVGPNSFAEDAQKIVHEWLNDTRPAGWDYQLRDEVGLNVIFERKGRFFAHTARNLVGVDFVPHIGVSLGNVHTFANAGGTVRLGFNLPSDFGVDLIRAGGAGSSPLEERDPRIAGAASLFVFGGVDGRAVARDIFLDGNTFRDGPSVDKKPFVADLYYGVGAILGNWQFSYTQVLRTLEFRGQDRRNYFGSATISFAW